MKNLRIVLLVFLFCACNTSTEKQTEAEIIYPDFTEVKFTYSGIAGIGHEKGCTRRDPSDVIKLGDTYYVYYTKVYGRSPGYWGTIWYAT